MMKQTHAIAFPPKVTVLTGHVENLRRGVPAKDHLARFRIAGTTVQVRLDELPGSFDALSEAMKTGEEVAVEMVLARDRGAQFYWLLSPRREIMSHSWHDRIRDVLRPLRVWSGAGSVAALVAITTMFKTIHAGAPAGWIVASIAALIVASLMLCIFSFHLVGAVVVLRQRASSLQLERLMTQQRQALGNESPLQGG
ncbi:hypothetical protein [Trinickia dinghuensis]|uniref:Uncharacterized protein n=1 Tax=Trinickia dinghuensis TaxID=2291023 RepID=A0A3D8K0E4_9BURK|nr:hypothetical protein [Trinickia dinghuensis]RDU98897.1 hypothetical protein DWV00_11635 [Trinickia dinghuensis]